MRTCLSLLLSFVFLTWGNLHRYCYCGYSILFSASCAFMFFSSSSSSPIRLIVFLFVMCRHVFFLIICQFFVSPMCENDFSRFFFSPFASSLMHNVILVLETSTSRSQPYPRKMTCIRVHMKDEMRTRKKKYVYMKEWTMNVGHFQQISYSVYLCVCTLGWSKFSAVIYLENGF